MTTNHEEHRSRAAIGMALQRGVTHREILEPLVHEELERLERQHRPPRPVHGHHDPDAPGFDGGLLAVFAAVTGDEPLWLRLVECAKARDDYSRRLQDSSWREGGADWIATLEMCAPRVRHEAEEVLKQLPANAGAILAVLARWEGKVVAAAEAEREQAKKGQRLREPDNIRVWNPRDYPDLLSEHERLSAELARRLSRDPRRAQEVAKGIFIWNRREHPDLAEAFDRIDDEVDRREGRRKPDIRVKVGDRVLAQGRLWKVEFVNERTGVVHLKWSDGKSCVSIPVDGDGLEPER